MFSRSEIYLLILIENFVTNLGRCIKLKFRCCLIHSGLHATCRVRCSACCFAKCFCHFAQAPTYFTGIINRQDAEMLLDKTDPGSFIIRVSDKLWGYALSYKYVIYTNA